MTTLEKMTCAIPFSAALLGEQKHITIQALELSMVLTLERPNLLFWSSKIGTPFLSSLCLISGMLIALAAATAANGTNRPIRGGALCRFYYSNRVLYIFICNFSRMEFTFATTWLRVSAVAVAAPVAARYGTTICLLNKKEYRKSSNCSN